MVAKFVHQQNIIFSTRYTKVYKVCRLHNNILFLKNKEDTAVLTLISDHQEHNAPVSAAELQLIIN
jgi:hypothetical protein